MKPIFAIDLTVNKQNEEMSGQEWVVRRLPEEVRDRINRKGQDLQKLERKGDLPLLPRILKTLCGYIALMIAIILLRALFGAGLAEAYRNAPYIFYIGIAALAGWIGLTVYAKRRMRRIAQSEDTEEKLQSLDREIREAFDMLGVPEGAEEADVLSFYYIEQDGKPVPKKKGMMPAPFFNLAMKIYRDGDDLCLADLEEVYAFPIAELQAIRTSDKRLSACGWNKAVAPNDEIYKNYDLTVNNLNVVYSKPYHVLEIRRDGERYGILFPTYDLPVFEWLTGLSAMPAEKE